MQNDLGETKTSNQKRFTINGRRNTRPGVKLPVNFFLKFDELGEIPQIRKIWIDGAPVCVSGKTENSKDAENKGGVEAETVKQNGISLSNLPFQSYPSVTSLPQQVNNVSGHRRSLKFLSTNKNCFSATSIAVHLRISSRTASVEAQKQIAVSSPSTQLSSVTTSTNAVVLSYLNAPSLQLAIA